MKPVLTSKKYTYGKQNIEEDDIEAVIDILKSDWLTQGPTVKMFEDALCQKLGSKYATAVANGTAALHLSGLALGWNGGDIVLTTPMTFVASANCILYSGATPDFVDIDPSTYTIDIERLEAKIKGILANGKKVKAVIAVDFAGQPCDWESLRRLADRYQCQLVEDACHAIGAKYKSESVCSSKYADATVLSFHPVKHITTGEGGAILTNDETVDKKVKILRTHGITKDEKHLQQIDGPWYYEMHKLGFNYRITDIQCALGLSQLEKLDRFIERRQEIAHYYDKIFGSDERFIIPDRNCQSLHAYHLYPLQVEFNSISVRKKVFFERLKEKNIFAGVHYIPVHLQPYYRKNFGFRQGDFPISEEFYTREVSIPIYPALERDDLEYITKAILESLIS